MSDHKISALLALSLISSPIALPASAPAYNPAKTATSTISSDTSSSQRASTRRMKHLLAATPVLQSLSTEVSEPVAVPLQEYIHPSLANHIDAPLPQVATSDQVVGIYGNILYPQDKEQIQQQKLTDWIEAYSKDSNTPFPLSPEDLNDISLYILDRFPLGITHRYFATQVRTALSAGLPLENALEKAREETLIRAALYKEMTHNIPGWKGRCEVLSGKLIECADQIEKIIDRDTKMIRANPTE